MFNAELIKTPSEIAFLTDGTRQEQPCNLEDQSTDTSFQDVVGLDYISLRVEHQPPIPLSSDPIAADQSTHIFPSDTTIGRDTMPDQDFFVDSMPHVTP